MRQHTKTQIPQEQELREQETIWWSEEQIKYTCRSFCFQVEHIEHQERLRETMSTTNLTANIELKTKSAWNKGKGRAC